MSDPRTPNEIKRLPPLLRRCWYGLNQAFRQRTSHLSLTPDQYSILRWLTEGDPAGLTQRQITRLMASDPNTITSTLARMEKAGLLLREPHERDRRAHRVKVLPLGQSTFTKARAIALRLQEQILEVLPEERREAFLDELEEIANACANALDSEPAGSESEEPAATAAPTPAPAPRRGATGPASPSGHRR